jgi:iron complex outermembrane receptor protein
MKRVWKATIAAVTVPCVALAQTAGTTPTRPAAAEPAAPGVTVLPEVNVIGASPLLGSGVSRNKVPAENQVLTGEDVSLQGPPNALRALENQAAGVTLDDATGNQFMPNVFYHGFQASPLQGNPQGLAVYLNGVRFNQPFGDTVLWDLIPDIAIDKINLEGANPVFGLNALGGSLSVQLRNGFTYHGGELEIHGGSFGTISGSLQYGKQSGDVSTYVALSGLHQDGWRQNSASDLRQLYADVGWRSTRGEVHLNFLGADNDLNNPGTVPVELLAADHSAVFTAPNFVAHKFGMVSLSGNYDVTDTTSLQALLYYNNFLERVRNGNVTDLQTCEDGSGLLCTDAGTVATDRNGNPIADFLHGGPYSQLDQQTTNTNGYGASFQVSNKDAVFGRPNHLVAGLSFDGAQTIFNANSAIGGLDLLSRNFIGPGIVIDQADGSIAPVEAGITDAFYGVFFTDTLDVTPALAATVSGRFNAAQINLKDLTGTALTGNHVYNRFNPGFGLTYKILPALTAYASYSEANRAPTPAELSCASPATPCSLANFFTGDPNLKQVVAHTVEAGLRGQFVPYGNARLSWNLSAFHTGLDDDILFVSSQIAGRAFFENIGSTRREGIDAGMRLTAGRLLAWIDYSYTDATFRNTVLLSSPDNPAADENGNILVRPGNHLPGIPTHLLKLGVQYKVTDAWTVGATGVAASGQYLFGDEANLTPKTGAYFVANANTSYQVTKNLQLFALLQNTFNAKYVTFGTFSPTATVPIVEVPGASNPRSLSPAPPIAAYGGMRITF